ncbi:hypothetical protein ACS0TY_005055 [Phlomoides rotata]
MEVQKEDTSKKKCDEVQKEETSKKKCDEYSHVSLPEDVIDKLKNEKGWEECPFRWTYNEEKMSTSWLWFHSKDDEDIHHLVFVGGKEDDVAAADQGDESTQK